MADENEMLDTESHGDELPDGMVRLADGRVVRKDSREYLEYARDHIVATLRAQMTSDIDLISLFRDESADRDSDEFNQKRNKIALEAHENYEHFAHHYDQWTGLMQNEAIQHVGPYLLKAIGEAFGARPEGHSEDGDTIMVVGGGDQVS